MSTRTRLVLTVEGCGPSMGERVARASRRSWIDLRDKTHDDGTLALLMPAFVRASHGRNVLVTVTEEQLTAMRVGHRRMLERLLLGYRGVVLGQGGRGLQLPPAGRGATPQISPLEPSQLRLGGLRGQIRTAKGIPPFKLPPMPPNAQSSALLHLAVLRGMLGGGGRFTPPAAGLGAGGQGASVLLVGDRPNRTWNHAALDWPFVSARMDGCSAWLAELLEDADVPEQSLHWINAYAVDGTPTLLHRTGLPGADIKLVVALGKNAATWCATSGLLNWGAQFREVHHPQHWKRFHHHHSYVLVKILRRHLHGLHRD